MYVIIDYLKYEVNIMLDKINATEIKEGYAREITELLLLYGKLLDKHITALTKPIIMDKGGNDEIS